MSLFSFLGSVNKLENNTTKQFSDLDLNLHSISFGNLSKTASEYLNEQQDFCNAVYKKNNCSNWYYDQYKGELTFSAHGIKKLIIDFEEVGLFSLKSNTWLWAWKNPRLEEKVRSEISRVRDFGYKRRFEKLTYPKWSADERDGWDMTAIAAYLMKAKGAFKMPSSNKMFNTFMIYKNIRRADIIQPN